MAEHATPEELQSAHNEGEQDEANGVFLGGETVSGGSYCGIHDIYDGRSEELRDAYQKGRDNAR